MRPLFPIVLLVAVGCRSGPGAGDHDAALELVYDRHGVPAFAGQALVIKSCGAGAFCHAEGIAPRDRFGAPAGLDFDLRLASTTVEVEAGEAERLRDHRLVLLGTRGLVWEQVSSGHMPPGGAAGQEYAGAVAGIAFDRFDARGEPLGPLPRLDTAEGLEIFRNWLASDAPVVERTEGRIDRRCSVAGSVAPRCERECVDPSWESIYRQVIEPSCARSRCHDATAAASDLDLFADLSGSLEREAILARITPVLDRIRDAQAQGSECRPERHLILVPGAPLSSLLYLKTAAASSDEVCGSMMPLSGSPLSRQRLCALREWIACGACAPADRSCDACVEVARATCGVAAPFDPDEGAAACASVSACSGELPARPACSPE